MRPCQLWAAAAVVLAVTVAACGSGSKSPTVPSVDSAGSGSSGATVPIDGSKATTAAAPAGSPGSGTPLAQGLAYSRCMRSHGVANWPDPALTPHGGYGYRTKGVDPQSAAFQSASQACKSVLPEWWGGTGQQLTLAQQQAWLDWAKCIRSHGVPGFPDPTFAGSEVHVSGDQAGSPQMQSAMDTCKSQMPSAGGLGG